VTEQLLSVAACRPGVLITARGDGLERVVTLRKLLARQILKLQEGSSSTTTTTSLQPLWGPQGFNVQDPVMLVWIRQAAGPTVLVCFAACAA
jgi:hypothetical protein